MIIELNGIFSPNTSLAEEQMDKFPKPTRLDCKYYYISTMERMFIVVTINCSR